MSQNVNNNNNANSNSVPPQKLFCEVTILQCFGMMKKKIEKCNFMNDLPDQNDPFLEYKENQPTFIELVMTAWRKRYHLSDLVTWVRMTLNLVRTTKELVDFYKVRRTEVDGCLISCIYLLEKSMHLEKLLAMEKKDFIENVSLFKDVIGYMKNETIFRLEELKKIYAPGPHTEYDFK